MVKQRKQFIGRVENMDVRKPWDYIGLNIESGGCIGSSSIESIAGYVAGTFGKEYRKMITYSPPRGIDRRGAERGLAIVRYHPLSIGDKTKFKREVSRILTEKCT